MNASHTPVLDYVLELLVGKNVRSRDIHVLQVLHESALDEVLQLASWITNYRHRWCEKD